MTDTGPMTHAEAAEYMAQDEMRWYKNRKTNQTVTGLFRRRHNRLALAFSLMSYLAVVLSFTLSLFIILWMDATTERDTLRKRVKEITATGPSKNAERLTNLRP